MIPRIEGARLPGLAELDQRRFWTKYENAAPFLLRLGFRLAVIALTWLPVLLHGRPFHRLPPDTRDAFLQRAGASRSYLLRQLVTVVKLIACFAFCFDPSVQEAVRGAPR